MASFHLKLLTLMFVHLILVPFKLTVVVKVILLLSHRFGNRCIHKLSVIFKWGITCHSCLFILYLYCQLINTPDTLCDYCQLINTPDTLCDYCQLINTPYTLYENDTFNPWCKLLSSITVYKIYHIITMLDESIKKLLYMI